MILKRVVGEIVKLNPEFSEMKIHWITIERVDNNVSHPSMWFEYKGWVYLAVCSSYTFGLFETYDDWDEFNNNNPQKKGVDTLLNLGPIFFKAIPEDIFKSDLGEYCDYELDFIKNWVRDRKINEILNQ